MKSEIVYMLGIVAAGFAVNYALRALPFLLFAGKDREIPKWITRFGDLVSPVIIGALIFYSYSGLQWRTAWPYLAGALVVGLQLWRRNALVSIVAGTVLYMCLLNAGCMSSGISEIELDADNPSIRYSTQGFLIGEKFVNPNKIPGLLEDFEIPKSRTIHILVDEDAERDLAKARAFMKLLAHHGYRRSVLVTKQRSVGDSNFLEISIRSGAVWAGTERITPDMVRIPVYIVVIASFVTLLQMVMQAYLPGIYASLGLFIPLIVVNCVILGRAEGFASKNGAVASLMDGIGIGLGFTLGLTLLGICREFLGNGSIFGITLLPETYNMLMFVLPPGAFITLGFLVAIINKIRG